MPNSIANCRSCGAVITWVLTPAGKRMPLDGRATLILEDAMAFTVLYAQERRPGDADVYGKPYRRHEYADALAHGATLYPSHFATCPNARDHSRGGAR